MSMNREKSPVESMFGENSEADCRPMQFLVPDEEALLFKYAAIQVGTSFEVVAKSGESYVSDIGMEDIAPQGMVCIKVGGDDINEHVAVLDVVDLLTPLIKEIDNLRAEKAQIDEVEGSVQRA